MLSDRGVGGSGENTTVSNKYPSPIGNGGSATIYIPGAKSSGDWFTIQIFNR